jgi:preprotein translocase subunit SecA
MGNSKFIEKDLRPYLQALPEIKKHILPDATPEDLLRIMTDLKKRAAEGAAREDLLPEVFAAVYTAVERALSITPHDAQLLASAAMAEGRLIELPTGEGKTLAAVFPACLEALTGEGVHVLTFNDYLAKRDALWMEPVYAMLGFRTAYIRETSDTDARKAAYTADITYLTAKEAGFDYLREFLAYDASQICRRPFHFAILDEADSILIDEARIPLVISGDIPSRVEMDRRMIETVRSCEKDLHYITDEYSNNISLTEEGIAYIEKSLGLENLYDEANHDLVSKINVFLQAEFLLKKDVDYIVRNSEVQLVDEFTGRVDRNREWPDGLQAAVELKEGLTPKEHGLVMNRITLRDFLRFYPRFCGMTGTAVDSAYEFYEFYGKLVTVIPPQIPCIRIDYEDRLFADTKAKMNALCEEIETVHLTGRPILIGTHTIRESELLADKLRFRIPELRVLNAKNDEEEAKIIADAGKRSAVTISTNMAGRGVDIRLGGMNGEQYAEVRKLGGLYVIGTNRHESRRIDKQLRGRAGRQGDPGESRFFVSFEDDLMQKYRLRESLPKTIKEDSRGAVTSRAAVRAVSHTQRVSEGQITDAKITLSKYSILVEDHRRIVHEKRMQILMGSDSLAVLEKTDSAKCEEIRKQIPEAEYLAGRKHIELYAINLCWADYLTIAENALDEVQMLSQVREDPLMHFNNRLVKAFDGLEVHIKDTVRELFSRVVITDGKIDFGEMGIKGPSSTRTYLVNDGTENFGMINDLIASANAVSAPLYALYQVVDYFHRNKKEKKS